MKLQMSCSTITKPPKQLAQLLKEQQEPFTLDMYLVENHGYLRKTAISDSEVSFKCSNGNSSEFLGRSATSGFNKCTSCCSKILKAIYKKLVCKKERQSNKNVSDDKEVESFEVNKIERNNNSLLVGELDRFSSASSTTVFNSCSESHKDETQTSSKIHHSLSTEISFLTLEFNKIKENKVAADKRQGQRRFTYHNQQCKLVSVKKDIHSIEEHNAKQENQITPIGFVPTQVTDDDDSILSASIRELYFLSATKKQTTPSEFLKSNTCSSQFLKSKRMLEQTRQLLFDCLRELVETHARKEIRDELHFKEFLGAEEIGKLLSERMKKWVKQSGDEKNITNLLSFDYSDSNDEWNDFDQQKRDVVLEIGDTVLEEMLNEIVTQEIEFLTPTNCF